MGVLLSVGDKLKDDSFAQQIKKAFAGDLKKESTLKNKESTIELNRKEKTKLKSEKTRHIAVEKGLKFDTRFQQYLEEVGSITGIKVKEKQIIAIKNCLKNKTISKIEKNKRKLHDKQYKKVKKSQIREWEIKTSQKWPTYSEDVLSKNGSILRQKGDNYDVHHIIEASYGGPNEWWNFHPASHPVQHQEGIHKKDGLADKIFK